MSPVRGRTEDASTATFDGDTVVTVTALADDLALVETSKVVAGHDRACRSTARRLIPVVVLPLVTGALAAWGVREQLFDASVALAITAVLMAVVGAVFTWVIGARL